MNASTTALLERLTNEAVTARPVVERRPIATGAKRPRARRSLADLVTDLRR